jgi:hypothetical protein
MSRRRVSKVVYTSGDDPEADRLLAKLDAAFTKRVSVFMGPLDWANPACHYSFSTLKAAQRFASIHQEQYPQRAIFVQEPVNIADSYGELPSIEDDYTSEYAGELL